MITKGYIGVENIKKHMKTQTWEKPFKWSECDKAFILSESLNRHIKVHTGKKPYMWSEFDKAFTMTYYLTLYMGRVHTGEKSYECTDKIFALAKKKC